MAQQTLNVTAQSGNPTAKHTTVVLSNVQGTFSWMNETVTGDSSNNASGTIQADRIGFKGVTSFDFEQTKTSWYGRITYLYNRYKIR